MQNMVKQVLKDSRSFRVSPLCPRPRPIVLKSNLLLQDFHGGPVVTNLPAKTGDMGSSLAWGDHMWRGNQICAL